MDFGDVHDIKALAFTLERCMVLEDIDGIVLSFMYETEMVKMFGEGIGSPEQILDFTVKMCKQNNKLMVLSFFRRENTLRISKS